MSHSMTIFIKATQSIGRSLHKERKSDDIITRLWARPNYIIFLQASQCAKIGLLHRCHSDHIVMLIEKSLDISLMSSLYISIILIMLLWQTSLNVWVFGRRHISMLSGWLAGDRKILKLKVLIEIWNEYGMNYCFSFTYPYCLIGFS